MITTVSAEKSGTVSSYSELRTRVKETLLEGQRKIEQEKVRTYWQTGKYIHQHLLSHHDRAEYGKQVISRLSEDLEISDSVLRRTVQFYEAFQISAPARKLSWAHYVEILPVQDQKIRGDFAERAEKNDWTRDDLRRKLREEFRGSNGSGTVLLPDSAPLKPKLGKIYTYRFLQPDEIHPERPYLLLDLGFASYRRIYKTNFKSGDIAESVWDPAKEDYQITKSEREEADLFTYQARVEKVVDGDTLRIKVDLGFDTWTRQYLRLRGLDCPEIDTPEGRKAKRFVESQLENVPMIFLTSSRSDKYDRYLADVFLPGKEKSPKSQDPSALSNCLYLNQLLLDKGYAVRIQF